MSVDVQNTKPVEQEFTKMTLESPQSHHHQLNGDRVGEHPLHQYDLSKMSKLYEACVSKLGEKSEAWRAGSEWYTNCSPMPTHLSAEEERKWRNPVVLGDKWRVCDAFMRLARESGEPMIVMPQFDISDLQSFHSFLDSLKSDGVNAIRRYRQYLNSKDMRKQEVDLVCVHAKYGVILVECKEGDHVDYKRKNRAKSTLSQAKSLFKSLGRLIAESKCNTTTTTQTTESTTPVTSSSVSIPVMEFVALPNVLERPQQSTPRTPVVPTTVESSETSPANKPTIPRTQLGYLIKSDLESKDDFAKWWTKNVVEPRMEQEKAAEEQKKTNKFDSSMLNSLVALTNCIRSNAILPVVYPSSDSTIDEREMALKKRDESSSVKTEKKEGEEVSSKDEKEKEIELHFQPALSIHAELFKPKHEEARSLTKCVVVSKDSERIRKTICLQTLWWLLNDSQKKISVVCSELNKPYYEEFFARQRKIYTNLNNVRFYTDVHSCDPSAQHTLRKDGEVWFFDSVISNGSLSDVLERCKTINSFWVFAEDKEQAKCKLAESKLAEVAKLVDLDEDKRSFECEAEQAHKTGYETVSSIKLPLRLQCDLLIVGDMISPNQLKYLYKHLQVKQVPSLAHLYNGNNNQYNSHHHNQRDNHHMQQLNFNPVKKFKSVKFVRGGTIDNIRNAIKMHDSIQATCVLLHVGDEDLFKTRNSVHTVERVKELATLVREYCPKSFVVLSSLMRRQSRTENGVTNEVNKGLTAFCKQTKEQLNCFYMLNGHFEPEYHTQAGRLLNAKGLKTYVDNILFVVDYFLVKNNKQH